MASFVLEDAWSHTVDFLLEITLRRGFVHHILENGRSVTICR